MTENEIIIMAKEICILSPEEQQEIKDLICFYKSQLQHELPTAVQVKDF